MRRLCGHHRATRRPRARCEDAFPRIRSHEEEEARWATILAIICIYELSAPGIYQNCARKSPETFLDIMASLFISVINTLAMSSLVFVY